MLFKHLNYGIQLKGLDSRIGNSVIWTHLPENYYAARQKKLIDVDRFPLFDHNPFVDRESSPDVIINLMQLDGPYNMPASNRSTPISLSRADNDCLMLGLTKAILRHPRLYIYEDQKIDPKKIVVHNSSYTSTNQKISFSYQCGVRVIPDFIIEHINEVYNNFTIVQIGSKLDPVWPGAIDCRTEKINDIWPACKEISTAAQFIGVDSGPMNLAFCYPRITKKILLTQFDVEFLHHEFYPMRNDFRHWQWMDHSFSYYNVGETDAGVTYSYKKL